MDYRLGEGSALAFGDPENRWELIDASAPQAMATATSGIERLAEDGLLALPDDDHPEVVVFEQRPGQWIAEIDGVPKTVRDHEVIAVAGENWRLMLPSMHEETLAVSASDDVDVGLHFEVSRDEEFTRIWLEQGDTRLEVASRAHHYMLLVLARARLADREAGLAPGEAGWLYVEDFCRMLGTEAHLLNVLVHRARRQFARLELTSAAGVVERRRITRQLRIGFDKLSVAPLP